MKSGLTMLLSIIILLFLTGLTTLEVNGQVVGSGSNKEIALGGSVFRFGNVVRKTTSVSNSKAINKTTSAKAKQSAKNKQTTAKNNSKQTQTPKNSNISKPNVDEKEDIEHGKIIDLPKPVYPKAASAVMASGTVEVEVTIDEDGNVVNAEAISGHPLLKAAAVDAAKKAKFTPTLLNKEPVKVTGVISYNFTK